MALWRLTRLRALEALALAFLLATLMDSECAGQQAPAQASGRSEKVKIAYPSRGITVLPLRIAQIKGFFRDEGLDLEFIQMSVGVTITALTTGDIDYAAPLDSIVRASARGQPLKAFISFVNKPMHYLVSRPEFNSVRDLKGKIIAVSSYGGSMQYSMNAVLKAYGLDSDKKDVQVVALGDGPVVLEALKRGVVDACIVLIPYVIVAEKLGFKLLANAGDFIDLSTPGLGTNDKLLRERPDQVKRVVRAALSGLLFLRQNRDESIRIMMEWLALDKDTAGRAYDTGLKSFSEDGSPSEKGLMTSIQLELEKTGSKKEVPISKVFDFSVLREVQKELKK